MGSSRSASSSDENTASRALPSSPSSWLTIATGMLLIPELVFAEKRPVINPIPKVIRNGASSIMIRAVGSRKINFMSLRAMINNFFIAASQSRKARPVRCKKTASRFGSRMSTE